MSIIRLVALLVFISSGVLHASQNFSLVTLEGAPFSLADEAAKGPLVFDLWATWCKPCIKSLGQMQVLAAEYEKRGVRVFSINIDGPRNRAKIRPFLQRHRLSLPVLLDDTGQIMRQFHFVGPPAALFFDRAGQVIHSDQGYRPGDEKKWRAVLDALLDEKPSAPQQEKPDATLQQQDTQ